MGGLFCLGTWVALVPVWNPQDVQEELSDGDDNLGCGEDGEDAEVPPVHGLLPSPLKI